MLILPLCVCVFVQLMWKTKNSTRRFWRTWGTATWPRTTMRCPLASSTWPCSPERSRHSLKIWWGDEMVKNEHPKNGNNSTKVFRSLSFIIHSHQHVESIVWAPQIHARWKWLSSSCGLVVLRSEIWGSLEPPTDNYRGSDNSSQTSKNDTTHTLIRAPPVCQPDLHRGDWAVQMGRGGSFKAPLCKRLARAGPPAHVHWSGMSIHILIIWL